MPTTVHNLLKTLAFLALAGVATFWPAHAGVEPTDMLGPLRLRDLTPFALQRLDLRPASAAAHYPEGWALEANLSYTNTFIMSGNVADYLEARDRRDPLGAADFTAFRAMEGDAFYFDGSISVLSLAFHYGVSDSLALYGILPVHRYHGGSFDATIESFHQKAGFSDFGRDLVAQDQFQGFFKIGDRQTALSEAPRSAGFADPVIGVRKRGLNWGAWDVVLELAAKLPIGANDPLFSSGHADIGAQVSVQRQWANDGLYFSVSYVNFGGSDSFGDAARRHIPSFTAAWETRVAPQTSVILQGTASRSLFKGETHPELAANAYQLSAGIRHQSGPVHYTFALTENVVNFNNTPDIGFHLGVGIAY
ncbi:MAG TPA: DUF3187 family protein [Gammaproteobacteria bacterium]